MNEPIRTSATEWLWHKASVAIADPRVLVERPLAMALKLGWNHRGIRKMLQRQLADWEPIEPRRGAALLFFDALFDFWVANVYLAEPDPDRREALKDCCMLGASGMRWANVYDSRPFDRHERIGDLSFDEVQLQFPAMDRLLSRASPGTIVMQIGSSSGRELAYFAVQFTAIQFLGLDIDPGVVDQSARRHGRENLRFVVGRAHTALADGHVPDGCPLIVFSSGSLQYVQPEHIAKAMARLAARGRVRLLLGEPCRDNGTAPDQLRGSRWRGNFSYSHDLKWYAEDAGFATVEHAIIQFDRDPRSPHVRTRTYYYHGELTQE